jgi:hypothetical protein
MNRSAANGHTETAFVNHAETRIRRCFAGLALAAEVALLALQRWPAAIGFALGALVAAVSTAHLQRVVRAFISRAAGEGSGEPAAATVMRFLVRFALITLLACVIFRVSRPAMYGYVAALFLPVAAMMCEAAWEAWFALRHRRQHS